MSLIGEALKKARSERGSDLPANVYAVPAPRRSNLPWMVAAASISLALGVLVGAALFYRAAQNPPSSLPPLVERSEAVVSPEAVKSQDARPTVAPEGQEGEPLESSLSIPPDTAASEPTLLDLAGPLSEGPRADAEPTAPASAARSTPAPVSTPVAERSLEGQESPVEVSGPVQGHSYFKEVTLADGRSLHLNGIVWSDVSPAALINSEVYAVGEGAGPWTLLEVERGEVQIEASGVRFVLRLK